MIIYKSFREKRDTYVNERRGIVFTYLTHRKLTPLGGINRQIILLLSINMGIVWYENIACGMKRTSGLFHKDKEFTIADN